jgi:hypothetical protein
VGNIDFEGSMARDTEGSDFIKAKLLDDDPAPLYLQVWGGTNTIARALRSIEDQYRDTPAWEDIYQKVSDKAIIYAVMDQDATYREYVAPHWPAIRIFYNSSQFAGLAYPWQRVVPDTLHYLLKGDFMGGEIINDHGPLLKQYYSYGDGQQQAGDDEHIHGDSTRLQGAQWGDFGRYDFISEGDSPAYLHLIDVGLNNLNHPEWGGWGGRLVRSTEQPNRWEDGDEARDYNPFTAETDPYYAQLRWLEAIQQDFAGRADWCIRDYAAANHPPRVVALTPDRLTARPGETIELAIEAADPDGDSLETRFWIYPEVGTYAGAASVVATNATATVSLPATGTGTLHVIAEVRDRATHPMTRYQRFVIRVE